LRNILVTGGLGFIGSNFIRYLLHESGYRGCLINVDFITYAGNPDNLADIEKEFKDRYRFIRCDICDRERMSKIFDEMAIDGICHFAAESHVDRSLVRPDAFIQTNIVGTFTLLELARKFRGRVELFHHVSTDEVYGSLGREGFFTEETPYRPNSPYSASKASSDHLVRAYHMSYGLPVTISNCSNNYGPYQFPEKLIPLVILNALEGKPIPVYGDGRNVRDWLYVGDHCSAIWAIMNKGRRGETYNVGGNNEMENIQVVGLICDILDEYCGMIDGGPRRRLITYVKDRPGHDRRYAIDGSKLMRELGWAPHESFATGIRKTVRWYLDNRKWVDRLISGEYKAWIKENYGTNRS